MAAGMSPLVWVARIGTDGPPQGDDPSVPAVVRLMRNRCEAEPTATTRRARVLFSPHIA